MPDMNDFYAYKMTTSDGGSGGGRNNNSTGGGNDSDSGCATGLVVLAIIGWVLWFIGRFLT